MSAIPTSDSVYTFSLTTDWCHTVNAVPPMSTAAPAAILRGQRVVIQLESSRSVMRNHIAADTALESAARTFNRGATSGAMGITANTRPISTNSGLPGGWGSPNVYAAVIYSLASHIAVDGASVTR